MDDSAGDKNGTEALEQTKLPVEKNIVNMPSNEMIAKLNGDFDNERYKRKAGEEVDTVESEPSSKKLKTSPPSSVENNDVNGAESDEDGLSLSGGKENLSKEPSKKHVELKVPIVKTGEPATKAADDVLNLSKKPLKESNQVGKNEKDVDIPIDLSQAVDLSHPTKKSESEDIIMLSDEEDTDFPKLINGFHEMSPIELEKTKRAIRKLQEELRNEETKLVLLKKIRQSQLVSQLPDSGSGTINKVIPPVTPAVNRPAHSQQPQQPGIKSNQQPAHAHTNKQPNIPGSQNIRGPQQPAHANHISANRTTVTGQGASTTNLTNHQSGSQLSRSNSSSSVANYKTPVQQTQSQVPAKPAQPEQSPAQRQAAAKLALRKQLEKTLLQIPPPKPPPPEMNFIPSSASADFVPLVGLEEVVKFIVEVDARLKGGKSAEVKYVFNPFTCVQCGTDFTPVWKRDKPGSKNVICEQCVTSNQKKALKQEHTNRLKSAFVKALQQEQEIEQRMQQAEKTQQQPQRTTSSNTASANVSNKSSSHHNTQSAHTTSHTNSNRSTSSSSSASAAAAAAAYKLTSEQLRQHQNLLQAHQQQLRSLGLAQLQNFMPHMAYPFGPQLTPKQAAEIQRQYLLDMIQPRSVPGNNLWRK